MENSHKRNIFLDLFKFVLCYFVISIHYNSGSFFYPIFRIAVPMFFMISGFFLYSSNKDVQQQKNIQFIKNSLKYMIVGFCVCFFNDLISCLFFWGRFW